MGILYVILAVLIITVFWGIIVTNSFKRMLVKITESESGIDVSLTKRYDTLTKLMEVVKAYTKHEAGLFEKVIQFRSGMSMSEKNQANQSMNEAARGLIAVAENYPELKSSDNYKQLQTSIVEVEDHLQAARRVYNMNVSSLNQGIAVFPNSIAAKLGKFTSREFFEAEEIKRADVKINL